MQKLKQLYRSTYTGENVITNLTLENSEWTPEVEHVPTRVFNTYTTTQAIVIGNGESRLDFNLRHIRDHRAGFGGANRLQSYGCNALYRDFTPDFLIASGIEIVQEIAQSGYTTDNIVYTNADNLIKYPGKFYLIPQNLYFDAGSLAVYMACFDGHKKIFLLGFDGYVNHDAFNTVYKGTNGYPATAEFHNETFLNNTLAQVISTYSDVEFIRVMPTSSWVIPDQLDRLPNFRQIDHRRFVIEADIG